MILRSMITKRSIVSKMLTHEAPIRAYAHSKGMDKAASDSLVNEMKQRTKSRRMSLPATNCLWQYIESLLRTLTTEACKSSLKNGQRTVKASSLFPLIERSASLVDTPVLLHNSDVVQQLLRDGHLNPSTKIWDAYITNE